MPGLPFPIHCEDMPFFHASIPSAALDTSRVYGNENSKLDSNSIGTRGSFGMDKENVTCGEMVNARMDMNMTCCWS